MISYKNLSQKLNTIIDEEVQAALALLAVTVEVIVRSCRFLGIGIQAVRFESVAQLMSELKALGVY